MDDKERLAILKECFENLMDGVRKQHLFIGDVMKELGRYEREEAEKDYVKITEMIADSIGDIHYLLYHKEDEPEVLEIA